MRDIGNSATRPFIYLNCSQLNRAMAPQAMIKALQAIVESVPSESLANSLENISNGPFIESKDTKKFPTTADVLLSFIKEYIGGSHLENRNLDNLRKINNEEPLRKAEKPIIVIGKCTFCLIADLFLQFFTLSFPKTLTNSLQTTSML